MLFGLIKSRPSHLILGRKGEKIARRYLRRQKMRLLTRNYNCKYGEIDLIMQDGRELVFVEVKTRTSEKLYTAEEAVNREKQKRIIKTAHHFINHYQLGKHPCRFDIVAVIIENNKKPAIRHLRDAFTEIKSTLKTEYE